MRAEMTCNGVRMVVEFPKEVMSQQPEPDGTMHVSCEILDVLEPPEARQRWLEYKKGVA